MSPSNLSAITESAGSGGLAATVAGTVASLAGRALPQMGMPNCSKNQPGG